MNWRNVAMLVAVNLAWVLTADFLLDAPMWILLVGSFIIGVFMPPIRKRAMR